MGCMKCGRDLKEGQLFCESCLEVMAKYPVKPGIAISLPAHKESGVIMKPHKRRRQEPTPDEQIRSLRVRLRIAVIAWLVTLALLCVMLFPYAVDLFTEDPPLPGQNYTTVTVVADPTEPG